MRPNECAPRRPNRFEIDLGAIAHNVREVRRIVGPQIQVFGALKADAYGFGLHEVADAVVTAGVDGLAMVEVKDAVELRHRGIRVPILLYGGVPADEETAEIIGKYDLMPTLLDYESAEVYSRAATRQIRAFVKVDVGLERLGVHPEEAIPFIRAVCRLPRITLEGIYTHLHVPDAQDAERYVAWQFGRFTSLLEQLANESITPPIAMAASTAVLRISDTMRLSAVDPGHMLYGLIPPGPVRVTMSLRAAFHALKSRLIQVKAVNRPAFRGQAPFEVRDNMRIGIIPIGLADGMGSLSCGHALVRGKRVPILAKPSLEHTRLDLTAVPQAEPGDEVVLIGQQAAETITPEEVAKYRKRMVAVELALAVRESVRRVYIR